jgi:protein TonB
MKSLILTASLFTVSIGSFAQTKPDNATIGTTENNSKEGAVFTVIEMAPVFKTGDTGWKKFLKDSIQYPDKAKRQKIEGKVLAKFIVKKDGSLDDIKALSGPEELKRAAVDVLKKSPKWIPAKQNGRDVNFLQMLYITFSLSNE